jgi:hypothetical protein
MARAAFLIEDHHDPRRSIFAFVRVCDAVANQGKAAGLVLDAISSDTASSRESGGFSWSDPERTAISNMVRIRAARPIRSTEASLSQ